MASAYQKGKGIQTSLYGKNVLQRARAQSITADGDDNQRDLNQAAVKTGSRHKKELCMRLTLAALFIISIPIWILLERVLLGYENDFIVYLQKNLSFIPDWVFEVFFRIYTTNNTLIFQIWFFLCDDSLLAFKASIIYCTGIYLFMLLKLLFQDPRPYWVASNITLNSYHCDLSYAHPS